MKETDEAYLAGVIDSVALFRVVITKSESTATGYTASPEVRISRSGSQEIVFGMLDEYCEEYSVMYNMDSSGDGELMAIRRADHIERFLEPLVEYFVQQYERGIIFLDDVLPVIKEGEHKSKQGMFELSQLVYKMYEDDPTVTRFKYDPKHFLDEWGDQLDYA